MNNALKKTLSIILTILMIALSIPVTFAEESPFDPNYRVTLKFRVYQQNIYNDIYTGPGFDTDGMGVTIYYLDDDTRLIDVHRMLYYVACFVDDSDFMK